MTVSVWGFGQGIGWMLTHSIWQAGLLMAGLSVVLRLLPTSLVILRYRFALTTLMAAVTISLLTGLALAADWQQHRSCHDGIGRHRAVCSSHGAPASTLSSREHHEADPSPFPLGALVRRTAVPGARLLPESVHPLVHSATEIMGWITIVWMAGAALAAGALLRGLFALRRLWRQALPVTDVEVRRALSESLAATGDRGSAEVRSTTEVTSPAAIWGRSRRILLPATLAGALDPMELRAVLSHELAHLRGRDPSAGLLQAAVCSLFFFNPFVLALSRMVDDEREALRDAQAAEGIGSRLRYGETLLALAGFRSSTVQVGVHHLVGEGELARRVRRLAMRDPEAHSPGLRRMAAGAVGVLVVSLLLGATATMGTLSSWAVMLDARDAVVTTPSSAPTN